MSYTLFHASAAGSVVPQIVLRLLNVPHEVVEMDWETTTARKDSPELQRLLKANPLAQFPTLLTPDGTVLTEMSAMLLYLVQMHGSGTPWALDGLTPAQLAGYYRFLVFVPAVVYPVVTFLDFPERYIVVPEGKEEEGKQAKEWMEAAGKKKQIEVYQMLENIINDFNEKEYGANASASKFALGTPKPTVLDVMIAIVIHWAPRPRPQWIEDKCPRLFQIAKETLNLPSIVEIVRSNKMDQFVSAE